MHIHDCPDNVIPQAVDILKNYINERNYVKTFEGKLTALLSGVNAFARKHWFPTIDIARFNVFVSS